MVTPVDGSRRDQNEIGKTISWDLNQDGSKPGPILLPKGTVVHHEIELAVVLDKRLSNLSPNELRPSDVYAVIRGVCLALDLTARNVQDEAKKKGLPWTIAKGFDTFTPISRMIRKEELFNKQDLQNSFTLRSSVNGVLRQEGSTELMLTPICDLLQYMSTIITLEPGDIILTGTPAGVGELRPEDTISGELLQNGKQLVEFSFDCYERPGPYLFSKK